MMPRSLMMPPGIPDFMTRRRFLDGGPVPGRGRAWSGWGAIASVEFSSDGGATWSAAEVDRTQGEHAWSSWRARWDAAPGERVLCSRATDEAGNTQPEAPPWN